jgi:hypothetical protein
MKARQVSYTKMKMWMSQVIYLKYFGFLFHVMFKNNIAKKKRVKEIIWLDDKSSTRIVQVSIPKSEFNSIFFVSGQVSTPLPPQVWDPTPGDAPDLGAAPHLGQDRESPQDLGNSTVIQVRAVSQILTPRD